MKRINFFGPVLATIAALGIVAAASASTPIPTSAVTKTRIFNDCPTSTVTVTNHYPSSIAIEDAHMDCFGFANLHNWHLSDDGANSALFNNGSSFNLSADLVISGTGVGEAGLQISPWWSPDVDGRFNVRTPDGEIACFGGRLPFYSFTGAYGIHYVAGETIHLRVEYNPGFLSSTHPGSIVYSVDYQGHHYTSGPLNFDQGNPAEDPPHGQWGILNTAQVGGYFQPRCANGNDVTVKATWSNIDYSTTPDANSAVTTTRIFNDCPTSTVTVTNNYPSIISIKDEHLDCFGFANLHNWSLSEDGTTPAVFNNNSRWRLAADLTISGSDDNAEAGLRVSPWWSPDVDGRFNVRVPDGEIACFGGRLPFYTFTGAYGLHYVKGTPIHLEVAYFQHSQTSSDPATIQYTLVYNGQSYTSGQLPFDQGNPAEDPPHGLWGMLNDGRIGGYFQPRLANGNDVTSQADFRNIQFSDCLELAAVPIDLKPATIDLNSKTKYFEVDAYVVPPHTASEIDVASLRLNGVAPVAGSAKVNGQDLKVKFDRAAVQATLPLGAKVNVFLSGTIGSDCFNSLEFVNVRAPKVKAPEHLAAFAPGATLNMAWDVDPSLNISNASVLASFDGGDTWTIAANGVANDGSYSWKVPNVPTRDARLALAVLSGDADETGPVRSAEVVETENFTILAATGVGPAADLSFALHGITPNPAKGTMNVSFSLPTTAPADIAVYDITGRQVASKTVVGLGRQQASFATGSFRPGVYLVRVTQSGKSLTTRGVVME